MIDLLSLEPQRISRDLKGKYILLYGLPGVGKTSLASEFKNVLIAGFEMGTNALNNVYVQPIKTWKDWRDMVKQLCTKDALKDKFDSIAIDKADFTKDKLDILLQSYKIELKNAKLHDAVYVINWAKSLFFGSGISDENKKTYK